MEFYTSESTIKSHITDLIIAGWTGRDKLAQLAHIEELESIGVKAPYFTPTFYKVGKELLTQSKNLDIIGDYSSGEVEFFIIKIDDEIYIGVASDITDRQIERDSVPLSKQLCPKPISKNVIKYQDLKDHWDEIIIRSHIHKGNKKSLYQEAKLSKLLRPEVLISEFGFSLETLPNNLIIFGGTISIIGEFNYSNRMTIELEDPIVNRKITHTYTVRKL
ncbi:DUF2848 family protein [Pseudoalteromonas mariniglutinosa]|uniref:DUF2848 family protein n=1 Tax=Pseudoalteromonas mariniglutinosa TaxID=206042 RepID=UPI00384FD37D